MVEAVNRRWSGQSSGISGFVTLCKTVGRLQCPRNMFKTRNNAGNNGLI